MQKVVSAVDGFVLTTAIKKLRTLRKRTRVIPGGSSAGKTFGILPILIDEAIKNPNSEISVVSESVPHLRKGALKDFLKIMRITGRYIDENYNKTQLIYTFANGSYIEFFSADQEDKVRGPRRHVLYINECNNLTFETYHQLAIRTSRTIWLDFNPSNEFWAYSECKEDDDTEWITLTYKDNEGLPESIKREIEKARDKGFIDPTGNIHDEKNVKNKFWANWWKVYGLGMLGSLEGVIFGNWEILPEIAEGAIPKGAVFIGSGNDFGYTNDPTAVVDVYTFGNKRILDERCYKTGLLNSAIVEVLQTGDTPPIIYADSAEPKSIAEIKKAGLNIHPVLKGKDSIMYGIQIMQQQDYLVTARSVNLIKELRQYCWDVDKNGVKLNKPAGGFDHCFVGETSVQTFKGEKRIEEIKVGDLILTSEGYKPLIRKWDNGSKNVRDYSLGFGKHTITLKCTPDHRIKTTGGWKDISQLKSGCTIYINEEDKIKTVKLRSISTSRKIKKRVYDLTVSDQHEYFANGVLVHNCIDAVRYHEMMAVGKKKRKATFGWGKKKPLPEPELVEQEIDPDYDVSDLI